MGVEDADAMSLEDARKAVIPENLQWKKAKRFTCL